MVWVINYQMDSMVYYSMILQRLYLMQIILILIIYRETQTAKMMMFKI